MANETVARRTNGSLTRKENGAVARVTPGADDCCCGGCPGPGTVTISGRFQAFRNSDNVKFCDYEFIKVVPRSDVPFEGECSYELLTNGFVCDTSDYTSLSLFLSYLDEGSGYGWRFFLQSYFFTLVTDTPPGSFKLGDDPLGVYPDFVDQLVFAHRIELSNIVVS